MKFFQWCVLKFIKQNCFKFDRYLKLGQIIRSALTAFFLIQPLQQFSASNTILGASLISIFSGNPNVDNIGAAPFQFYPRKMPHSGLCTEYFAAQCSIDYSNCGVPPRYNWGSFYMKFCNGVGGNFQYHFVINIGY